MSTNPQCPERITYNFIKHYLSDKTHLNTIEIGTLHHCLTKYLKENVEENKNDDNNVDIDGIDEIFPWRARGFSKFSEFVKSIPGLKWSRSIHNNHCVCIDDKFENIEPFFVELEKVEIKIQTMNQRKEKRLNRKKYRHKKQDRSFHDGFDVLLKLPFLPSKLFETNDDHNIINIRDSFYSKMINVDIDNDGCLNNINWDNVPNNLCPEQVILNSKNKEKRGTWKKQQIQTFYEILKGVIINRKNIKRIVDFGCGSGWSLPFAFLFPQIEFILIDIKPQCIKIVNQRIIKNGLKNVKAIQCKIEEFDCNLYPFDIGIGCHVCGSSSDYVINKCISNGNNNNKNCDIILCSCCVGKIENGPQSKIFNNKWNITNIEYNKLSSIADHNETDNNHAEINGEQRNLCKTILEIDRCFHLYESNKYKFVLLTKILPYSSKLSSSPKNDIIIATNNQNITNLFSNPNKIATFMI